MQCICCKKHDCNKDGSISGISDMQVGIIGGINYYSICLKCSKKYKLIYQHNTCGNCESGDEKIGYYCHNCGSDSTNYGGYYLVKGKQEYYDGIEVKYNGSL